MSSFGRLFKYLMSVSRWGLYREIIRTALHQGYKVVGVRQYWDDLQASPNLETDQKYLVLRHDIDSMLFAPLQSLRIESELGVSATYYFRWETAEARVIRRVREMGGEVGLHHESLRYEMIRLNLREKEEITDEVLQSSSASLLYQIQAFEGMFGRISSMASHGSPEHRQVGRRDIEIYDLLPSEIRSRIISAYDQRMLDSFDEYISDYGKGDLWRYGVSPIEAMSQGKKRVCFLSHPIYWDFSKASLFRRLSLKPRYRIS